MTSMPGRVADYACAVGVQGVIASEEEDQPVAVEETYSGGYRGCGAVARRWGGWAEGAAGGGLRESGRGPSLAARTPAKNQGLPGGMQAR